MSNKSEKLTSSGIYTIADYFGEEARVLFQEVNPDLKENETKASWIRENVRAIWTGEKRPPKRGEFYLSGAIIQAYRTTHSDLTTPYHIARLVAVEYTVCVVASVFRVVASV